MDGKSPAERGKLGTTHYVFTEAHGLQLDGISAPDNRDDYPLPRPTLKKLSGFDFYPPKRTTVHLDAGYDSTKTRTQLTTLECEVVINAGGESPRDGILGWSIGPTHGTTEAC